MTYGIMLTFYRGCQGLLEDQRGRRGQSNVRMPILIQNTPEGVL